MADYLLSPEYAIRNVCVGEKGECADAVAHISVISLLWEAEERKFQI